MDCSCHEPAVFGHLECELALRGHMSENAARARLPRGMQLEMDLRAERNAEINRVRQRYSQLVNDLLNVRLRYGLK